MKTTKQQTDNTLHLMRDSLLRQYSWRPVADPAERYLRAVELACDLRGNHPNGSQFTVWQVVEEFAETIQ